MKGIEMYAGVLRNFQLIRILFCRMHTVIAMSLCVVVSMLGGHAGHMHRWSVPRPRRSEEQITMSPISLVHFSFIPMVLQ